MKIHDHEVEDGEVELQADGEIVEVDEEWTPGEPPSGEAADEILTVKDDSEV